MRRRIILAGFALLIALSAAGMLLVTLYVSRPAFDDTLDPFRLTTADIAPIEDALTLARVASPQGLRLLLVRDVRDGSVSGIDISEATSRRYEDPVDAYQQLGHDRLADLAAGGALEAFPISALRLPMSFADTHIAAGTNFRAHAREAMLDGEPFLFPKLSAPTPWDAPVPMARRLDYEAELCAVTLNQATDAAAATLGFMLCNDYTDRWTLLRDIDLSAPMGTTGFAAAKGRPGFLPVGPLLVIPRDADAFLERVQLELYVNDRLRQRAPAQLMIWKPREIMRTALRHCGDAFAAPGSAVQLTGCDAIAPRTLILTGTPAGVIFRPVNIWYGPAYLRSGDQVVTMGTQLGWLINAVDGE